MPVSFGTVSGRPFLGDLGGTYIALAWCAENPGVPFVSKMNKATAGRAIWQLALEVGRV